MIKIAVDNDIHVLNHNESGMYAHRAGVDCPCQPIIEHFNEGQGYVFIHRNLDEIKQQFPPPPASEQKE